MSRLQKIIVILTIWALFGGEIAKAGGALAAYKLIFGDSGSDGLKPNTVASCTYAAPDSTVIVNTHNLTNNLAAASNCASRNGLNTYGSGEIVAGEYGAPSFANLQNAVAAATAAGRRLLLTPGIWPVSADYTINCPVVAVAGAVLTRTSGSHLTFNGPYNCGLWQSFNDNSTSHDWVVFGPGAVKEALPQWWGALADGSHDDCTALQAAIESVRAISGSVFITPSSSAYNYSRALTLYSNIALYGAGFGSHLHSTNTTRLGGIRAIGTALAKLCNIKVHDLRLTATTSGTPGITDFTTGSGIYLMFCDKCQIYNNYVSNWSDSGIGVENGDRNNIHHNNVKWTAQNIQVVASAIDSNNNIIANNISGATLLYNGLHTEGSFGGSKPGKVNGTIISGNVSADAWELGIESEVSTGTIITGNRVTGAGVGNVGATVLHGIYLFGCPNSVVTGNEVKGSLGYGIVIGAGSSSTSVSGNTTKDNVLGSCLVTDSGVSATTNVAMGTNSWSEGDIAISGTVSFLNRTRKFSNVPMGAPGSLP